MDRGTNILCWPCVGRPGDTEKGGQAPRVGKEGVRRTLKFELERGERGEGEVVKSNPMRDIEMLFGGTVCP